jgi:hypothetical protein
MSESSVKEEYGFKVSEKLSAVNVLGFADDTVIIAKSEENLMIQFEMISERFYRIVLGLNERKTKIIHIQGGKLESELFHVNVKW